LGPRARAHRGGVSPVRGGGEVPVAGKAVGHLAGVAGAEGDAGEHAGDEGVDPAGGAVHGWAGAWGGGACGTGRVAWTNRG